jgi:VWFA-related protein
MIGGQDWQFEKGQLAPRMTGKWFRLFTLTALLVACSQFALSQEKKEDKKQDIPDAPSAAQPPQPFPTPPPGPRNSPPPEEPPPAPQPEPPAAEPSASGPPVMPPSSSTPGSESNSRDDLPRFHVSTNFVQVPVTVKDEKGLLVNGLLPKDFEVLENGEKQKLTYFTSDPFPLSAAVIFDLGMPDAAVQKVNQTFPALEGAFSQFDEVSFYVYSGTVSRLTGFSAVGQELTDVLGELKTKRGRNDGVPVTSGPFGPHGPVVNGTPVDQPVPLTVNPPKEAHVINDAILAASLDLAKRDRKRRRIIFVISDGHEMGSIASYSAVMKVLLTNEIVVYAVGVGGTSIPGYGKLQKLHLPRLGTGDILPKYASATGGELFTEISRENIDAVYARVVGDARNQYTLGYSTKAVPGAGYREIEVRVARPDCKKFGPPCVRTYAKDGYYPTR